MPSRLRVGLVATSDFMSSPPGGITTFVRTVASCAPDWVDVQLVGVDVGAHRGPASHREIAGTRVPFVSIGAVDDSSRVPVRLQSGYLALRRRRMLAHLDVDVMYVHSPEIAAVLSCAGPPIAYQIHGGSTDMRYSKHAVLRNPIGGLLFSSLVRRSIKKSRFVMGVNQRCRDLALGQCKPYENVPPSIDTSVFSPAGRSVGNGSEIRLGYVGRIDENKNVTFILSVAEHLHRMGQPVTLSVAGDGPLLAALRDRVRVSPIRDSVALLGPVAHADTADFLRGVDVFMMASRVEGLPTALLEAMACGCAVVVPDLPGILEAVTDGATGVVYSEFDAHQVARTVKDAWDRRATLSAAASRHVRSAYSAQATAERICVTLRDLAEARSTGGAE